MGNISFNKQHAITVNHQGCQLGKPVKQARKLILPLEACISNTAGEIAVLDNTVEKIHWTQHTPNLVWVVVTFTENYHATIETLAHQYKICFPTCNDTVPKTSKTLFLLQGITFQIPLEGMLISEFIDRSIGYEPKDVVKDGLPHFGSKRDDWLGRVRKHQGYDIYINQTNVVAAAAGVVKKIGKGYRAGLYIKLDHGKNGLYTVYVHLKSAHVKEGQKVRAGEVIGMIDGPSGNAVEAQLHFEIKINNKSVDPLPFIEDFHQENQAIIQKIQHYKQLLVKRTQIREGKVKAILKPYE